MASCEHSSRSTDAADASESPWLIGSLGVRPVPWSRLGYGDRLSLLELYGSDPAGEDCRRSMLPDQEALDAGMVVAVPVRAYRGDSDRLAPPWTVRHRTGLRERSR